MKKLLFAAILALSLAVGGNTASADPGNGRDEDDQTIGVTWECGPLYISLGVTWE